MTTNVWVEQVSERYKDNQKLPYQFAFSAII